MAPALEGPDSDDDGCSNTRAPAAVSTPVADAAASERPQLTADSTRVADAAESEQAIAVSTPVADGAASERRQLAADSTQVADAAESEQATRVDPVMPQQRRNLATIAVCAVVAIVLTFAAGFAVAHALSWTGVVRAIATPEARTMPLVVLPFTPRMMTTPFTPRSALVAEFGRGVPGEPVLEVSKRI